MLNQPFVNRFAFPAGKLERRAERYPRGGSIIFRLSPINLPSIDMSKRNNHLTSMEDGTTPAGRKGISLDDFQADLARRLREAGDVRMPRNAGTRRTASKRALLQALAELDAKW